MVLQNHWENKVVQIEGAGLSIIFLTNPCPYMATLPALSNLTYLKKTHTKYIRWNVTETTTKNVKYKEMQLMLTHSREINRNATTKSSDM